MFAGSNVTFALAFAPGDRRRHAVLLDTGTLRIGFDAESDMIWAETAVRRVESSLPDHRKDAVNATRVALVTRDAGEGTLEACLNGFCQTAVRRGMCMHAA